jgi:hypothetical protein
MIRQQQARVVRDSGLHAEGRRRELRAVPATTARTCQPLVLTRLGRRDRGPDRRTIPAGMDHAGPPPGRGRPDGQTLAVAEARRREGFRNQRRAADRTPDLSRKASRGLQRSRPGVLVRAIRPGFRAVSRWRFAGTLRLRNPSRPARTSSSNGTGSYRNPGRPAAAAGGSLPRPSRRCDDAATSGQRRQSLGTGAHACEARHSR